MIIETRSAKETFQLGKELGEKATKGQVYTIIDEKNGWGKLKSGAGWINLDYAKKL